MVKIHNEILMESLIFSFAKVKINKGTGAGGANTNLHGLRFEELTKFKLEGYTKKELNKKNNYYLKNLKDKNYVFVSQKGLVDFFKINYNIQLFRHPDEAFIISEGDNTIVKILEKKEQHVDGSVETKLWSALSHTIPASVSIRTLTSDTLVSARLTNDFIGDKAYFIDGIGSCRKHL